MNSKHSLEELLNAALQEGEVKYTESQSNSDVVLFMDHYGIKSGNDAYSRPLIELIYKFWTKRKIFDRTFHGHLRRYIEFNSNSDFYYIDESALKVSREELLKIAVDTAFKYRVVSEEEKKEDQREIRRIKSKKTTQAPKGIY